MIDRGVLGSETTHSQPVTSSCRRPPFSPGSGDRSADLLDQIALIVMRGWQENLTMEIARVPIRQPPPGTKCGLYKPGLQRV